MIRFGFFADANGDRVYDDTDFAAYFAAFVSNGVFASSASSMQVLAGTNMTVNISPGWGFINGRYAEIDANGETATIAAADGTYARYDYLCLRCDFAQRSFYIYDNAGTPSASPTPPALTRDGSFYDLALAKIYVPQAATAIAQTQITDTRGNSELCGWVTGLIQQINTTSFFAQYEAEWAAFVEQLGDDDHVTITTSDTEARAAIREQSGNISLGDAFKFI